MRKVTDVRNDGGNSSGLMQRTWCLCVGVAILAASAVGCTLNDASAPPLQGPSELGLAITLSAIPDILSQDGASQAQIIVEARDANGQPARSITLRIDMLVDGVLADFGSLSARTLVTDSDGRATVTYTAPRSITGAVDVGQTVTVQVTPFGTDFANSVPRRVTIRLIPPGVLLPGGPTPQFTIAPEDPIAFTDVAFDASGSSAAPGTQIASYSWDFDDGATASGQVAFHRFAAGNYVVTLTVTDTNNVSRSVQKSLTVGAGEGPTASFVFSPTSPVAFQSVLFNGSQSTAASGRRIVRYDWNFGSGAPQSGITVTKCYDVPGTYTVVLTVADDVGQTDTEARTVSVAPGVGACP